MKKYDYGARIVSFVCFLFYFFFYDSGNHQIDSEETVA